MDYFQKEFSELSQKVADAIQAVLNIDVTIMNGNMFRIAGTGVHRNSIYKEMSRTLFEFCLKIKQPQVIDNIGINPICKKCARVSTCEEKAIICVPLIVEGDSIGVIGIVAFSEEQRNRIIENKDIYLNFVEKMAALLESKYLELKTREINAILSERFVRIMNNTNEGIIIFDTNGKILYTNRALKKVLKSNKVENIRSIINEVWKFIIKNKIIQQKKSDAIEINVKYNEEAYILLASVVTIQNAENKEEIFVFLQDFKKLHEKVIRLSGNNQIKMSFDNIIGMSPQFLEAKKAAEIAAKTDSNIFIFGESGTGKEMFARAIHNTSERKNHPFVPINCGAIPDELLESELFGHEKGSFTGAVRTKPGKFEVASQGTIFLDEISAMPFRLQVKLLRVLQEKELSRVGSVLTKKVDVRVISASNENVETLLKEGLFREDLYYRLNVVPIIIPPLRKRKDDILFITEYFIEYYRELLPTDVKGLSKEAERLLLEYSWPGNIRELQNVIEYAMCFERGDVICGQTISKRLLANFPGVDKYEDHRNSGESLKNIMNDIERKVLQGKVDYHRSNSSKHNFFDDLCAELKIGKATLYRKIKLHGIKIKQ